MEATGAPLRQEAEKSVENVLIGIAGGKARGSTLENFSQRDVTILLADLRGFTSLTAAYSAGIVLELLNRCFVKMSETMASASIRAE